MEVTERLARILEQWDLLKHPFYRAWSDGTLPQESLRHYAREYGAFIGKIADGWSAIEDLETAHEERQHAMLWSSFAAALGTHVDKPQNGGATALVDTAQRLFAEPATALGALYAFEAQQPGTSRSKLDGLRHNYELGAAAETYFEVHADDNHEAQELLKRLAALPEQELESAVQACQSMALALWEGLTALLPEGIEAPAR